MLLIHLKDLFLAVFYTKCIDFLDHIGIIVGWGSDHKLIQIIPNFLLFRKREIIPWWPWVAIEFGFQCVKSSLDAIRWCQCSNSLRYT